MSNKTPYLLAFALAAGVGAWMYSGDVIQGGQDDARPATIAERNETNQSKAFLVEAKVFSPEKHVIQIEVRGSTEASKKIAVRSETTGILATRHVSKGQVVKTGQLICEIKVGDRDAVVSQRRAELAKAQSDLDAAIKLAGNGYATQARVNDNSATLDAAKAALASAEVERGRIEVRSPIDGVVIDPFANVGDMLQLGDTCANVMQPGSMIMIAQVSERFVGRVNINDKASILTATGHRAEGRIKYIAPSADIDTRTFRVEIDIPNDDGKIKDGVTSLAKIDLPGGDAHLLPASVLTLDDTGQIGVKTIDEDNKVQFRPVRIMEDSRDGVWVNGLNEPTKIITRGQEYVVNDQTVNVELKTAEAK